MFDDDCLWTWIRVPQTWRGGRRGLRETLGRAGHHGRRTSRQWTVSPTWRRKTEDAWYIFTFLVWFLTPKRLIVVWFKAVLSLALSFQLPSSHLATSEHGSEQRKLGEEGDVIWGELFVGQDAMAGGHLGSGQCLQPGEKAQGCHLAGFLTITIVRRFLDTMGTIMQTPYETYTLYVL